MKQINERDELKLALQMETESTLESADAGFEVAASKEKLKKAVVQETAAVDVSTDSTLELAAQRDKLVKAIKNESDASDVQSDATLDLSVAKDELAKKIADATISTKDEAKTAEELDKALQRRIEIEEEIIKQQPVVNYAAQLNNLNAKIAEALKEKFDELKKNTQSETSVRDVNDKYKKQAEKELASRRGIFKRVNKSLEKTAKTSESGLARMSSKMMLGAGNMISDKINDFMDNIPVVGQLNQARRFIKENNSKADDAKHKRLVRERASELRAKDRKANPKPEGAPNKPGKERKLPFGPNNSRDKQREEEKQTTALEKILEVLNAIRTTQLVSSFMNIMGTLSSGLLAGIGGAVSGAFAKSGITKVLATLAGALGAGKLAGKLMDSTKPKAPTPNADPNKNGPKPGTKPPTPEPSPTGGTKPPPTKTPGPGDAAKGGKGGFVKAVGKALPWVARGAVRLMGPVGLAYTAYEIANMAGLTKPLDDMVGNIWDNLKGQSNAVTENQVDPTGDKPTGKSPSEKLTIHVTPGKEQLAVNDYVSKMQQCTADGTSFMDCKRQIKGTAEATGPKSGDELERLSEQKRKAELEVEKRKEQREAQTAAAVANASSSSNHANINSSSVVNNNTVNFNGSEYQTSHQKGSQVQR